MKKNLILKHQKIFKRNHVLILLSAIACFFITSTKSIAKENVFTINNIEITGIVDLNFSREKYINRAFKKSFKILINKILLTRDFYNITVLYQKCLGNLHFLSKIYVFNHVSVLAMNRNYAFWFHPLIHVF